MVVGSSTCTVAAAVAAPPGKNYPTEAKTLSDRSTPKIIEPGPFCYSPIAGEEGMNSRPSQALIYNARIKVTSSACISPGMQLRMTSRLYSV